MVLIVAGLGALTGCAKPPSDTPPAVNPLLRLEALPPADAQQVSAVRDMKKWKNPYLIIRVDGVGLLDPANNEQKILTPDQVVNALGQLPVSAWPYGRAVAISESVPASDAEKTQLRRNRALVAGALENLHVAINWVPSA